MLISDENNLVENLPDISKIDFTHIHKKYLKVLIFNVLLIFLVVLIALFTLMYFSFIEEINEYWFAIFTIVFILFSAIITFLKASFPKRKYAVRTKDISYKSGIFYKKLTTVPFSRIQHIEVDETPLARLFNIAILSVFTAGDSSDDLVIKGLEKQEALRIKEFISRKIDA